MKRIFLTLAMVLCMFMLAQAQKFNPFSLQALEEVNANDQQKQKFKELTKEYEEKLKAIRSNNDLGNAEKREEIKKLNQYRNKVYWKEILTKQQATALREKQKAANATGPEEKE